MNSTGFLGYIHISHVDRSWWKDVDVVLCFSWIISWAVDLGVSPVLSVPLHIICCPEGHECLSVGWGTPP